MKMTWLTKPLAAALTAAFNKQADALRADVKDELTALRGDLPNLVEAAVEGGTNAVINQLLHPFGHAAHLDAMENAPITDDGGQAQARPLTPEQRANLEKLRDRHDPNRQTLRAAIERDRRP